MHPHPITLPAKKELIKRHIAHLSKTSTMPAVEIEAICKNKPRKYNTANGLTSAIVDFITYSGGFASRIASTGRKVQRGGKEIWIKGTTKKGIADISAVYKGLPLSIEVKVGRDKMSDAQQRMKVKIESAGGVYFIADTFDNFFNWWITNIEQTQNPINRA